MIIPGLICLVCSVYIMYGLRDSPESLGLPSIEKYRNDYPANYDKSGTSLKMPIWAVLKKYVFNRRAMWFLAAGNFFAYIVRFGVVDWAPTYLVEVRGVSLSFASIQTMSFEAVGILGSLFAGFYSDRFFKGRRAYFNALLLSLLFIILMAFPWLPAGMALADAMLLGFMGFLIYGPLMLVSISAADISGKFAAGAATGFTGLFGYLGSSVSGAGTGYIIDQYGWLGCFQFFGLCAAFSALCFILSLEGGLSLSLKGKKGKTLPLLRKK
jgi:sugar phosphate permease